MDFKKYLLILYIYGKLIEYWYLVCCFEVVCLICVGVILIGLDIFFKKCLLINFVFMYFCKWVVEEIVVLVIIKF